MAKRKKVLTLKQLAEQIESSNKEFEKMTPAKQRVEIAEDCLARISIGQFEPETGCTFSKSVENYRGSVKDVINDEDSLFNCSVCAKGGLFMSYVGRVNTLDFGDLERDHKIESGDMKFLTNLFEPNQLEIMEVFFEGVRYGEYGELEPRIATTANITKKELQTLDDITDVYYTPKKRLEYICKNLIENKGTFVI